MEDDSLYAMSAEELKETLDFEERRHLLEMETLAIQKARAASLLFERKEHFRDLITRVTNLRVELSSLESDCDTLPPAEVDEEPPVEPSTSNPDSNTVDVHTGSERVDQALGKFLMAFSKGRTKWKQLLTALDASVQLEDSKQRSIPEGTAFPPLLDPTMQQMLCATNKTTNLYFISRNEIRGLKTWWEKHHRSCDVCGERNKKYAQMHSTSGGGKSSAASRHPVGSLAVPHLQAEGGDKKKCHRLDVSIVREPSLQDREDERTIEVVRLSGILGVRHDGQHLEEPKRVATEATAVIRDAVKRALATLVTSTLNAKWMQHDDVSGDVTVELKVAVEMLLHALGANASVSVVEQRADCTFLRVFVALTVPTHVQCVQPLLEVANTEAHRRMLVDRIFVPLVQSMCQAVGLSSKADFFSSVTSRVAEICEAFWKEEEKTPTSQNPPTAPDLDHDGLLRNVKKKQLYNIMLALSIVQSKLSFSCAVPPVSALTSKEKAMDVLMEIVRGFVAPSPPVELPATPNPQLVDFVLRLEKFPTNLLEVLNKTFTSADRVASNRRTGSLDAVLSPQTKIAMGLKLFSEMVIDVYRPFAPSCGVVVAEEEEKSQSFFKKSTNLAPPCTPRTDLPSDILKSNIAVHEQALELLAKVDEEKQRTQRRAVEEQGREIMTKVRERISASQLTSSVKNDFDDLGLQIVSFYQAEVDVAFPFGMDASDFEESQCPILYVNFVLTEKE